MESRLQKWRPFLLLLASLIVGYFALPFIYQYHRFCSEHTTIDEIDLNGNTWQLSRCLPRPVPSFKKQPKPEGNIKLYRYHLTNVGAAREQLRLVANTPRFYGNLKKLQFDQLRQAGHRFDLGLQWPQEVFELPGPRELEILPAKQHLRVVFGDGKFLEFAPMTTGESP
jgi:hypothetical protein